MDSSTKTSKTSTSTTSSSSKQQPPKEIETPIYMKFLSFWFLIIQFVTVLFSWRVYFLLFDNNKSVKKDKDDDNTNTNNITTTFKDKIQNNFYSLFTDIFYMIMLIITCTLFFWRCKQTITNLSNCKSTSEYKSIIWNQFYGGFIEFGSFTVLLLLKWPVIFKVYWNKGTDKEDKSTWSEIFLREFSADKDKNSSGVSATSASKSKSSGPNIFGKDPNKSASSTSSNKRVLTDDQWRHAFRVDLQNIGFEFDLDGEISKFPPTEVMEQYQKSEQFKDLILSAGSIKKSDMDRGKTTDPTPTQEQSKSSKDKEEKEIIIEEETKGQEEEPQEEQQPQDNQDDENQTTTTTTSSRKGKKGKKGKK